MNTGTVKGVIVNLEDYAKGNFKTRRVTVDTKGDFPQFITVEFSQKNHAKANSLKVGDIITAEVNINGRKWTNPQGEIKYFNSLGAWKVEVENTEPNKPQPKKVEYQDDLPF